MLKESSLLGIGVDIVELQRVRNIGLLERFAEYFLTQDEIAGMAAAPDRAAFIASRFAAKEATIKAFPGFLRPHDFEIIKEGKKPQIRFMSQAIEDCYQGLVSIAHSTEYVAGYAMIFKK